MQPVSSDDGLRLFESAMGEVFGAEPARASVSFVGVEPIEILRFAGPGSVSLLTRGMSRRPMGDETVAQHGGPRAELLAQVHGDGGELWRRLGVLAAAPVVEGVVYSDGMTVELGGALDPASICTGGLIVASDFEPVLTPVGVVAILRFVPATATELAYSRVHGSSALRERWQQAGTDLHDLARAAVELG